MEFKRLTDISLTYDLFHIFVDPTAESESEGESESESEGESEGEAEGESEGEAEGESEGEAETEPHTVTQWCPWTDCTANRVSWNVAGGSITFTVRTTGVTVGSWVGLGISTTHSMVCYFVMII